MAHFRLVLLFFIILSCKTISVYGFHLYIRTTQIFSTSSTPNVHISCHYVDFLEFRLYKVPDPVALFSGKTKLERKILTVSPRRDVPELPTLTEEITEEVPQKPQVIRERLKQHISVDLRRRIRELLGISWRPIHHRGRRPTEVALLTGLPLLKTWVQGFRGKGRYGHLYETVNVPNLGPGVYVVEAVHKKWAGYTVLIISDLGFVSKQVKGKCTVFCCNSVTGMPWSGAKILTFKGGSGFQHGNISPAELVDRGISDTNGLWEGICSEHEGIIIAHSGPHFAVIPYYAARGEPEWKTYLSTDRPLYRPGHRVHFKGIVRQCRNGNYLSVPNKTVSVDIKDPKGNIIFRRGFTTNYFGSFSGEFDLPSDPPLGQYILTAVVDNQSNSVPFEVQKYRKPEFSVKVDAEKDNVIIGEEMNFLVEARYFFGAPVSDGKVEYTLMRTPRLQWQLYEYEEEYNYGCETILRREERLDRDGRLRLTFIAEPGREHRKEEWRDTDYVYTLWVDVTDKSNRVFSGSAKVTATRAEFQIKLSVDKYLYKPKDTVMLNIETIDYNGRAVDSEVEVKVFHYDWQTGEERIISKQKEMVKSGFTNVKIPLHNVGTYRIVVTGKDSKGRNTSNYVYIYVHEHGTAGKFVKLQILPDKMKYSPGDKANIVLKSPVTAQYALITIEGERIFGQQLVKLDGLTGTFFIDIKEDYIPNVYIVADVIFEGKRYSVQKNLEVEATRKFIKISVKPDKEIYRPDEFGKLTLETRDINNNPISCEVALSMVDESIYHIVSELATPIQDFFYGKIPNYIGSVTSLDFWMYGYAREQAVEMALGRKTPTGWAAIKPTIFIEPRLRKRFLDTMFWQPHIITDENGYATVNVHYPDNLTTWRITARAVSLDTKVGQVVRTTIVRKDLLVRPILPRFYTQNDIAEVYAVVHNYLPNKKTVKVSIETEGIDVLEKNKEVITEIQPNSEITVSWTVEAKKTGLAKFVMKALTDEESDAVELSVPILPHGIKRVHTKSGEIKSDKELISFNLPKNINKENTNITLYVSPSIASVIIQAIPTLIGYPYGCVEQTMSKFGPTLAAARSFRELALPTKWLPPDLPKMVNQGIERLLKLQHSDGGWGWWEYDQTHPFMTAYALWGLLQARSAGYDVNPIAISNGLRSLRDQIQKLQVDPTTLSYMIFVLSLSGEHSEITKSVALRLFQERNLPNRNMTDYARALLAISLKKFGLVTEARTLLTELEKTAKTTQNTVYWEGTNGYYSWQGDKVETTAAVLRALLKVKPGTPLASQAMHWLIMNRRGSSWKSTKDTAACVYALIDYLKSAESPFAGFNITVKFNNKEVISRSFSKEDMFKPEANKIIIERSLAKPGNNIVEILRTGPGVPFYTLIVEYFDTQENIPAQPGHAFEVKREYFKLIPRETPAGIIFSKEPVSTVKIGDEVYVKTTVKSYGEYEYFMLEDMLPSGFEVVKEAFQYRIEGEPYTPYEGRWIWWYTSREIHDDRVVYFVTSISPGVHSFGYVIRPEHEGEYHTMPAVASLMYFPEVRATSDEKIIKVKD